ncbi:MscS family membrane protein [Cytobacillus horneckiae]|uniref:Mechanosensitive ion channel family protein n=1 Tax=Cytobacillus horneckiae TaxID=549687 RepID=A0A2N0ZA28_9BACI|nr:mechanosensitive ion channel family protein [Cytobacillus horneckiae]MBN6885486.1 mechanosensitive ion channel family protein [Cytobacillus horneckiae]MCM3178788.1 mechanosensitive ion channel family protein [Cytobacillus horneckiae]MEC1158797.1 mechanosensitive ion channel family protein [Cytobacillus horneckiae]MED2937320.1 mechanosensitive ion channel family protein [Cytobacillus horneckiae]PKG26366.1 mechanosensitive ion channel family protein [Cytobacillus horneckiae]
MDWQSFLTTEFYINLGISIGIVVLFLIFRGIFAKYVFQLLLRISRKTHSEFISHFFLSFEKPVKWLFIIIGVYVAAKYFPLFAQDNALFLRMVRSSMIVLMTWGLYNFASASSVVFVKLRDKYRLELDDILIPFLSKTLRIVIVVISASVILEEFGYHISGLVAGLGIGGAAIAFAAKDAIGHLFGGFVIITEKPFTIGDWVKTPSVEGTVEDITFRSTKVRTFADAIVTLPNGTIANEPITNWSRMGKRQISFNLSISHETPKKKVQTIVQRIHESLKNNPEVHPDTIFVTFDEIKDNSYDIFLYFFTNTTVWGEFLKIKEEINFTIIDILEQEGVIIALESTRVYVDSELPYTQKLESKEQKGELSLGKDS